MHVVFLPKYYPGGRDRQLGEFIRRHAVAATHHAEVSVVAVLKDPQQPKPYVEEITEEQGVWTLRAYYRSLERGPGFWRAYRNLMLYRKAARRAWTRFRAERGLPQLVHVHVLTRPSLLALRAWRKRSIPFLITEHSSEFINGRWLRRSWLNRAFTARVFRKAMLVSVVSDRLGRALMELGLVDTFEVVPNVLPTELPIAKPGAPTEALVVADLADDVKNISGVLEAFALMRDELPMVRLTIVGGGDDERKLKELCTGFQLNDRVTFTGRLGPDQALARIAEAGFLIVNSRVETFSVVTGEALLLGKPVIATRCGGPEMFINEHNGVLIPVDNPAALVEAIRRVVRNHAAYDPQRIRAGVDERFSERTIGKQLELLYRRVLDKRP